MRRVFLTIIHVLVYLLVTLMLTPLFCVWSALAQFYADMNGNQRDNWHAFTRILRQVWTKA